MIIGLLLLVNSFGFLSKSSAKIQLILETCKQGCTEAFGRGRGGHGGGRKRWQFLYLIMSISILLFRGMGVILQAIKYVKSLTS